MAKDYYQTLGLSHGASIDEVKQAYRKLSKELHPDKHKGDKAAEARFKEVNEAYEVLGNPQKKEMFDRFGTTGGQAGFGGAGGTGGFDFGNMHFGDFGAAGDFADLFGSFFGGAHSTERAEGSGADLEGSITVTLVEVLNGADRKLNVRRHSVCATCDGSGAAKGSALASCKECGGTGQIVRSTRSFFGVIQQSFLCPVCKGRGKVPERPCSACRGEGRTQTTEEILVHIPPGVSEGQTLRIRGKGHAGARGAKAGDLYVSVHVEEDPRFTRDGSDIRSALTLSVLDAILGTTAKVETLHGSLELKIPEGTQPGQVFRLRGKGLPELQGKHVGDHYVEMVVDIPKKLSREERKIVEEWRGMRE